MIVVMDTLSASSRASVLDAVSISLGPLFIADCPVMIPWRFSGAARRCLERRIRGAEHPFARQSRSWMTFFAYALCRRAEFLRGRAAFQPIPVLPNTRPEGGRGRREVRQQNPLPLPYDIPGFVVHHQLVVEKRVRSFLRKTWGTVANCNSALHPGCAGSLGQPRDFLRDHADLWRLCLVTKEYGSCAPVQAFSGSTVTEENTRLSLGKSLSIYAINSECCKRKTRTRI